MIKVGELDVIPGLLGVAGYPVSLSGIRNVLRPLGLHIVRAEFSAEEVSQGKAFWAVVDGQVAEDRAVLDATLAAELFVAASGKALLTSASEHAIVAALLARGHVPKARRPIDGDTA